MEGSGLYKIYPNIECENCKHSFTSGEFPQKLKIKYKVVHEYTRWGPEFLECPKCEHHYLFLDRKPFHKMNIIEKCRTLFVMLLPALFSGLPYGIGFGLLGTSLGIIDHFFNGVRFDVDYHFWPFFLFGIIGGFGSYFSDFIVLDKDLDSYWWT
jgi:uncharacterized C2H2 Zn-finger protein